MSSILIRRAGDEDARQMAQRHVESWRAAYGEILNEEALDAISQEECERAWAARLDLQHPQRAAFIAEVDGRVTGLVYADPCTDPDVDSNTTAEVKSMSLHAAFWGRRVGRRLLAHLIEDLRARGFKQAVVWVLEGNRRAVRSYTAAGWKKDPTAVFRRCAAAPALRYRRDL